MAQSKNLSTKMVFEYVDPLTEKSSRWTLSEVLENVSDTKFEAAAEKLNALQDKAYNRLMKTVETRIF